MASGSSGRRAVTFNTLHDVAARLGESVDGCATVAVAMNQAPTAAIVCSILCLLHDQAELLVKTAELRHQIKVSSAQDGRVSLIVHHVPSLSSEQLSVLRQVSTRIELVRFVFRQPETRAQLGYGWVVCFSGTTPAADADGDREQLLRLAFVVPTDRQRPKVAIDWTNSVVAAGDRTLVLDVLDDVYNMAEFMPVDMLVSLEPIETTDYRSVYKKRTSALGSETEDEDGDGGATGRVIGYALHFSGIPSCDDSFFAYMAHKYKARWAGFQLFFPRTLVRDKTARTSAQHLVVRISAENSVPSGVREQGNKGARQLARKLHRLAE